MNSFVKFKWLLFIATLVVSVLPILLIISLWWLIGENTAISAINSLMLSALITSLVTVLVAIGFSLKVSRPLKALYRHLLEIKHGNSDYKTLKPFKGFVGKLFSLLNNTSELIQQLNSRSQTELSIITAEASRLRNVLNSIKDGVVALDKNLNIILFNKAAAEITGFSLEEAAGKPVSQILPFIKGNALVINDWLSTLAGAELRSKNWESLRIKTKDGHDRSVNVYALYKGADPNGVRTLITFHDRTQAQELEDMKVDFVALAAHELRTPISVIRGYLEILEDEMSEKLNAEQKEFFRKLTVSASQLSGFINNILHVSRIEHGDLNLKFEVVDWTRLIKQVLVELQQKAETQGKKIILKIPDKIEQVAVDKMSITEVINNLVDNAIKYSNRNSTISLTVRKSGEMIETIIKDQGLGIPENAIDKLFTKFYRSHRTRTSHRGTGLGLYMSKSIVEAHGGSIWVHSKVGGGSTFGFMLPTYNQTKQNHIELENNKITRGVHGWIKNHSLYRG